MAEIDIERKERSIWPWIIGGLVVLLLVWGVAELFDSDDAAELPVAAAPAVVDPMTPAAPAPPAPDVAMGDLIPVAAIMTAPAGYVGQTISGTAQVAEVISDRGFWIEEGGQRAFAVIDEPKPEIKNIRAGQTVRLDGAQVMTDASQVPGALEAETQRVIGEQNAFIYVRAPNILIIETAG